MTLFGQVLSVQVGRPGTRGDEQGDPTVLRVLELAEEWRHQDLVTLHDRNLLPLADPVGDR